MRSRIPAPKCHHLLLLSALSSHPTIPFPAAPIAPSILPVKTLTSRRVPVLPPIRRRIPLASPKSDPEPNPVQDLRVPDPWLLPPYSLQESEWLRVTLRKWLDDEYCPEETNVEISLVAAESYYRSLRENETDLGVILIRMARELESISYKDSFHGAFSSANAAVDLIAQRIQLQVLVNMFCRGIDRVRMYMSWLYVRASKLPRWSLLDECKIFGNSLRNLYD